MKLRNKKTGEIAEVESCNSCTGTIGLFFAEGRECDRTYESLAELNSEWEDYEEPNERWYINDENEPQRVGFGDPIEDIENLEELGLLFKTEEEAKKAVEKLKAWKRLKDKGLHVTTFYVEDGSLVIRAKTHNSSGAENWDDLALLFGGEE